MGYPEEEARGALRFSLGPTTTAAEMAEAAELVVKILAHQREAAATLRDEPGTAHGRPAAPVGVPAGRASSADASRAEPSAG
jgi:hypothetical protein